MTFLCITADKPPWYLWRLRGGALCWGDAKDHERWAIAAIWQACWGRK